MGRDGGGGPTEVRCVHKIENAGIPVGSRRWGGGEGKNREKIKRRSGGRMGGSGAQENRKRKIGRETEIERVSERAREDGDRVVTACGEEEKKKTEKEENNAE